MSLAGDLGFRVWAVAAASAVLFVHLCRVAGKSTCKRSRLAKFCVAFLKYAGYVGGFQQPYLCAARLSLCVDATVAREVAWTSHGTLTLQENSRL